MEPARRSGHPADRLIRELIRTGRPASGDEVERCFVRKTHASITSSRESWLTVSGWKGPRQSSTFQISNVQLGPFLPASQSIDGATATSQVRSRRHGMPCHRSGADLSRCLPCLWCTRPTAVSLSVDTRFRAWKRQASHRKRDGSASSSRKGPARHRLSPRLSVRGLGECAGLCGAVEGDGGHRQRGVPARMGRHHRGPPHAAAAVGSTGAAHAGAMRATRICLR